MKKIDYLEIDGDSRGFYTLAGILALIAAFGAGAAFTMEHAGHWITGMSNQVIWGTPHVFAVFLIVAASGALNIASMGTVFDRHIYQPLGRLSSLLAIALLVGGLLVLVLDLGRPDRLIVAMTVYNFKSIFAWNVLLYTGFIGITGIYLWFQMDRSMGRYYKIAGYAAFIWRLILTTGTGAIFGFIVARDAFDSAIYPPMFIINSFAYGMAFFILVLLAAYKWTERPLGDKLVYRLKNLLGVFVAAAFYFLVVYHLTGLYHTKRHGIEAFFLMDGGIYTQLFWIGQVLIGMLIPMFLVWHPTLGKSRSMISAASTLVIIGGLSQMYVTLIGGQAYPLNIFPGYEVISSSFYDGGVNVYSPSLFEVMLGIGGIAIALLAVTMGVKILRFLPTDLSDQAVDPHHTKA